MPTTSGCEHSCGGVGLAVRACTLTSSHSHTPTRAATTQVLENVGPKGEFVDSIDGRHLNPGMRPSNTTNATPAHTRATMLCVYRSRHRDRLVLVGLCRARQGLQVERPSPAGAHVVWPCVNLLLLSPTGLTQCNQPFMCRRSLTGPLTWAGTRSTAASSTSLTLGKASTEWRRSPWHSPPMVARSHWQWLLTDPVRVEHEAVVATL